MPASGPTSPCARDARAGGMVVDATCSGRESTRPLDVLARHLTFGLTRRDVLENGTATVGGREAAHSVVRGVADGPAGHGGGPGDARGAVRARLPLRGPERRLRRRAARVPGPGRELRAGAAAMIATKDLRYHLRETALWYGGLGLLIDARGPQPDPAAVLLLAGRPRDRHHRRAVARGRAHRRALHRHGAGAADRGEHGALRRRELRGPGGGALHPARAGAGADRHPGGRQGGLGHHRGARAP